LLIDAGNASVQHLDGAILGFGDGIHEELPDASHSPMKRL
jgi:hypothetical protein